MPDDTESSGIGWVEVRDGKGIVEGGTAMEGETIDVDTVGKFVERGSTSDKDTVVEAMVVKSVPVVEEGFWVVAGILAVLYADNSAVKIEEEPIADVEVRVNDTVSSVVVDGILDDTAVLSSAVEDAEIPVVSDKTNDDNVPSVADGRSDEIAALDVMVAREVVSEGEDANPDVISNVAEDGPISDVVEEAVEEGRVPGMVVGPAEMVPNDDVPINDDRTSDEESKDDDMAEIEVVKANRVVVESGKGGMFDDKGIAAEEVGNGEIDGAGKDKNVEVEETSDEKADIGEEKVESTLCIRIQPCPHRYQSWENPKEQQLRGVRTRIEKATQKTREEELLMMVQRTLRMVLIERIRPALKK
ncbi:hypothetical protein QFC21_006884 [Naganishia friedmannii]|uniref:Uncharacterized protein n=1 Tax=Naganishia friedmannii TaxID=89922 RepID=A0ACC2V056_9TREE|nr:hypothetical protein QFC21_006884 [Naganishia friedmannii]